MEETGSWQDAAGRAVKQESPGQRGTDLVVTHTENLASSRPGSEPDLGSATFQLSQFSHLWYGVMVTTDPPPQGSHKH